MPAYRNRPDRRKFPKTTPEPLQQPLLSFIIDGNVAGVVTIVFSEPIIELNPGDDDLLNSIRVWMPANDFLGACGTITIIDPSTITAEFGQVPTPGSDYAIWIFDQRTLIRSARSGAICTGNPVVAEAL